MEVFTEPGLILEIMLAPPTRHPLCAGITAFGLATDRSGRLPARYSAMDRRSGFAESAPTVGIDTRRTPWPVTQVAGAFSANTTHIMHWPAVEGLFRGIGQVLQPGGAFCLYGPFNDNGCHTSASNAAFDQMLKQRDPASGIATSAISTGLRGITVYDFGGIIRCRSTTALVLVWTRHV